jgi:hypothetical protein
MAVPNPFELANKRIERAAKAFLQRHEAAIERFWKGFDTKTLFVGMVLLWPYMYLFMYGLLISIALLAWYVFSRLVGLAVPHGNLFQIVWSYFERPVWNSFILFGAMFIVGFWVFMLRTYNRAFYGFVEMVVGAVIASSVDLNDADQKKMLVVLAGGLYVMVRGLDNMEKGLPPEHFWSHMLRYYAPFLRHWLMSDQRMTLQQVANPAHWRTVVNKDALATPSDDTGVSKLDSK